MKFTRILSAIMFFVPSCVLIAQNQSAAMTHDLAYAGTYSASKTYSSGNVVTMYTNGPSYISLMDNNLGNPVSNLTTWSPFTGATGVGSLPPATSSTQGTVQLGIGQTSSVLGSAASQPSTAFDAAGTAATAQANSLQIARNLGDLPSTPTARTNLGLGTASTQDITAFDPSGAATAVQTNLNTTNSILSTFQTQINNAQPGVTPAALATAVASSTGVTGAFAVLGVLTSAQQIENITDSDCKATVRFDGTSYCNSQFVNLNSYTGTNNSTMGMTQQFVAGNGGQDENNNWRVQANLTQTLNSYARGIRENQASSLNCHANGDCIGLYLYPFSDGGSSDSSGESIKALAWNSGETSSYMHGNINATSGLYDTDFTINCTSGQCVASDGASIIDTSQGTSNVMNGGSTIVSGNNISLRGLNLLNPIPVSTAWAQDTGNFSYVQMTANSRTILTRTVVPYMIAGVVTPLVGPATAPAIVTGSITGNTLTVTSIASGVIAVTNILFGNKTVEGTKIVSQTSGTTGGIGVYALSKSVSAPIASGTIYAASTLAFAGIPGPKDPMMAIVLSVGATPVSCTLTGSTSGGVLTVTSTNACVISPGASMYLVGAGVYSLTLLTAQTSGTAGGAGTYTISSSQTIASETMAITGTQTVTAAFRNSTNYTPYYFQGGVIGQYVSFDNDLASGSGMRSIYNLYGSLTGYDAIYWINLKENQQGEPVLPQTGNQAQGRYGPVHIYPGAEIVSETVIPPYQVNTLNPAPTVELSPTVWAARDTIENPHYNMVNTLGLNGHQYQSSPTNDSGSGNFFMESGGQGVSGNYTFGGYKNDEPASDYFTGGGHLSPPSMFYVDGHFANGTVYRYTNSCMFCVQNADAPSGTITASVVNGILTVTNVAGSTLTYGLFITPSNTAYNGFNIAGEISAVSGQQDGVAGNYGIVGGGVGINIPSMTMTFYGLQTILGVPGFTISGDFINNNYIIGSNSNGTTWFGNNGIVKIGGQFATTSIYNPTITNGLTVTAGYNQTGTSANTFTGTTSMTGNASIGGTGTINTAVITNHLTGNFADFSNFVSAGNLTAISTIYLGNQNGSAPYLRLSANAVATTFNNYAAQNAMQWGTSYWNGTSAVSNMTYWSYGLSSGTTPNAYFSFGSAGIPGFTTYSMAALDSTPIGSHTASTGAFTSITNTGAETVSGLFTANGTITTNGITTAGITSSGPITTTYGGFTTAANGTNGFRSSACGTATSGTNYGSCNYGGNSYNWQGSYWNGTAAVTDGWYMGQMQGSGTTPLNGIALVHNTNTGGGNGYFSLGLGYTGAGGLNLLQPNGAVITQSGTSQGNNTFVNPSSFTSGITVTGALSSFAGTTNSSTSTITGLLTTNGGIANNSTESIAGLLTTNGGIANTGGYTQTGTSANVFNGTTTVSGGLKTGNSTNTDLTGELSFSGATTASYTFAQAYTIHPEVVITAQFNVVGNGPWVTYTGSTSFTINFATAATGVVTYYILGRN